MTVTGSHATLYSPLGTTKPPKKFGAANQLFQPIHFFTIQILANPNPIWLGLVWLYM
jgi:hypothetical protein